MSERIALRERKRPCRPPPNAESFNIAAGFHTAEAKPTLKAVIHSPLAKLVAGDDAKTGLNFSHFAII
jgi:hypothetical protein